MTDVLNTSEATGKWLVRTNHSEYLFDFGAMTVTRVAGKEANRWHDEDVTYPLIMVDGPIEVGESMQVFVDHEDLWIRSTKVQSITPVWVDDASAS